MPKVSPLNMWSGLPKTAYFANNTVEIAMSKKYDARLLKSYRSYKIKDVCRLYRVKKLHEQTIRGWIAKGELKAFWHGNTIYIYGAVLKQFFVDRNSLRKAPLAFHEFRCWKCKATDAPLNHTIEKLVTGRNKSLLALGVCASCGHEIQRLYKADAEPEILSTFTVKHNAVMRLSDSVCSKERTHIENMPEMAATEPLANKTLDSPAKSTRARSRTHIKPPKNLTSTDTAHTPSPQLNFLDLL